MVRGSSSFIISNYKKYERFPFLRKKNTIYKYTDDFIFLLIEDKEKGTTLKFHRNLDRNVKLKDLKLSLSSPVPFAYACIEKSIYKGQGIYVNVKHIESTEAKPRSFHLGIGISHRKPTSASLLDFAPFLFTRIEKSECLGNLLVCISKRGNFHVCKGNSCIYTKDVPFDGNHNFPLYVWFEIFRVRIELMETLYCNHSGAVEYPMDLQSPVDSQNADLVKILSDINEKISTEKITPELQKKFSTELTEYANYVSIERSKSVYSGNAAGRNLATSSTAIEFNRDKIIGDRRIDSGVFKSHLRKICADFVAKVNTFPLCDHLLQFEIFHQNQYEAILDEHKLNRQEARRSLFRILVKKEYTPEELKNIWTAFRDTKQESLLPKLGPA